MRINKIKIAGFKSFVDPTTLEFRRNLNGIVGPNGCGKSNIIDAIQWVMGESSAKHLRGDSMADVVFNGSGTRQPVGQASVELIFDNSDGKIGGQYASYSEISVKRQVGRDAQSAYFLNGVRCRRRDITGMFLGTGIGARSYSIIEQGMISRVVDAKPEDLRAFLEEAAGISKYKERRRETENRIHGTQENLARITDIVNELDKQLQHLQRQAKSAERYQELKREERAVQAQLHALRWRSLQTELSAHRNHAEQRTNALEATTAALRGVETEIVQQREQQSAATDHFNEVQSKYYGVGADVARLEQQIQHAEERRQAMDRERTETQQQLVEADAHISSDEQRFNALALELTQLEPQQLQHRERESAATAAVDAAERALNEWQARWDALVQLLADVQRQQHVEETRQEHLEDALQTARHRVDTLLRERNGLVPESLQSTLVELQTKSASAHGEHQRLQAVHTQASTSMQAARAAIQRLSLQLDELRQQRQQMLGRRASLEALQQASMGSHRDSLVAWLQKAGLDKAKHLSDVIDVDAGWEHAVEVAGRIPLHALCVDTLSGFIANIGELHDGSAAALEASRTVPPRADNSEVGLPLLADKIRCSWPLQDLFAGVYAADSHAAAHAATKRLAHGEAIITADGTWFGAGWVRADREQRAADGLLQRSQELKQLSTALAQLEREIESADSALLAAQGRQAEFEQHEQSVRNQLLSAQNSLATFGSDVTAAQMRVEQTTQRLQQISEELSDLSQQTAEDEAELRSCAERLQAARAQREQLEAQRDELTSERDRHRDTLQVSRGQWQNVRDAGHTLFARSASISSEHSTLEQSLSRNRAQVERLRGRVETLKNDLQAHAEPFAMMQRERNGALERRRVVETELAQAREAVQHLDAHLRELDQRRHAIETEVNQRREEVEAARLECRGVEIRLEGVREQLNAQSTTPEEVLKNLAEDANEAQWENSLAELGRKIQRLGPINLAAIEEFTTLSERKSYLDTQLADLTEALSTLEEAIRKIDRETRTRFKETFDKVNTGFQTLFPVLFGGGHAVLELTGEDLLETGVSVIARPPGKRNSTIHLLSGGEKALTAVSLIFAIFELNPAPFCLLDEVDAPLDDANVVRLCEMLRQRARDIQFIFITHNKITMEIADQLVGVTMQEAGVSRLVAVNMDEAVRLAATA